LKNDEFGKNYRQAVAALYNTAVEESAHKPASYIKDPTAGRKSMEEAFRLGLKNFRGHTLVWDKSNTFDPETGVWKENTSVSEELSKLIYQGDKEKIDAYMQNTIKTMVSDTRDEICEWDVANEVLSNNEIRSKFGNDVLVNWFKWAREADADAKLYINETGIVGNSENGKMAAFKEVLDDMVKRGVDFDGIGIEITADGSSISTGELEMSNVDLSAQFTDMIITQRGFQANSRVITTSDTLLEELINLKR
jgi:GH35 family endo-1,4-beta-xylanase